MGEKIASNFVWRLLERWGAQGVSFVVSIILARIINPDVYGSIALVMVFTSFLQVFIDCGLGTALIQKKEADDVDFSSVFWFYCIACLISYAIIFFIAPVIAVYFDDLDLISVIRVLGLTLIISGVKSIQQAYVARNLMFKKFFFSTLTGTLIGAVVGIVLAYAGFGIWALVIQYVLNNAIDTVFLWVTVKWRPKFVFSLRRFRALYDYGWKMLLSSLLDTFYNELRSLIIGKVYTKQDLAFYEKGKQFPELAVSNINSSMNTVLLPVLADRQADLIEVKKATRKVIRLSSFVIWPMMVGLCIVARKMVLLLYSGRWGSMVFYLQILCIAKAFQPLQTTNLSVIKALGKADLHLKLEVVKKTLAITIVIVSTFLGMKAIAIGSLLYSVIATFINSYPNKKLIDYSYFEQLKDILPFIMISAIMGVCVYGIGLIPMNDFVLFCVQIIVGISIVVFISVIIKLDTFYYLLEIFKTFCKK